MRKLIVLAVLIILIAFSSANAQDLMNKFNVSPFAGIGIPTGAAQAELIPEAGLYRNMGIKFGANAEYFFTPNIGAGVQFMYATFSAKDVLDMEMDDKLNLIMFGVQGKYVALPESEIRPYGVVGAGLAMPTWKDFEDPETEEMIEFDIDSKPYLSGAIGAIYFVSPMVSVFAEAGGHYIMTEGATTTVTYEGEEQELEFDYDITFIDVKVGVNIWFGGSE